MPIPNQQIGSTNPKSGTLQFNERRIQGIPLKITDAAGVDSVSNRRIVSLQEDTDGVRYACVSPVQLAGLTLIGFGVLEEALQSGGVSSIAPDPNNYVDGDIVTVLRGVGLSFQIDYDPSNEPTLGIGQAYVDQQGRLSSVSSGSNVATTGSVFASVPGIQMTNQLKTGCLFFQFATLLHA